MLNDKPDCDELNDKPDRDVLDDKPDRAVLDGKPDCDVLDGKPNCDVLDDKPDCDMLDDKPLGSACPQPYNPRLSHNCSPRLLHGAHGPSRARRCPCKRHASSLTFRSSRPFPPR